MSICVHPWLKESFRIAVVLFSAAISFAAAPDIDSISPLAVRPGVPIEVTFSGSGLDHATNVWANFSAQFESLGEGRFRVTVPSNCPVGIGAVRLYGSNGVSPLSFLMIDDLPTVANSKTNRTRASAQPLSPGSAIDGRCEELGYDWFKVHAGKGQRLTLEVVATRLGSRLDSVLRVLDDHGKPLAQNDDVPGLRGDSCLTFTAPEAGDYFIELRDVNYGGGSEFFYHLRVGDFPLATTAFPAAVTRGTTSSLTLAGPAGEVGEMANLAIKDNGAETIPLAVRGANGSTFASALVTSRREIIEHEPNDTAAKATPIQLTDGINGRFDKANDVDFFGFVASKGDRLEFRAATRSLGAPCDAVLEIVSTNGATLARSNPSAADEGVVSHKFDAPGQYRLVVQEATGASGPNCLYRITAQRAPGFALTLDTDRINVAPGKSFELKVICVRGDYKGPVRLAVDGIEGLNVTNNLIADGKTNATMRITVPESMASSAPRFFSVTGVATRDGAEVQTRASTAPVLRRRFPQMLYPPAEFDGAIALGFTP